MLDKQLSIILPAKNEAEPLKRLLPRLKKLYPHAEIIVVNDHSQDSTALLCESFKVKEVRHPYSKGNGAAIKSGARAASGEVLVFMDADGQHDPDDIARLLKKMMMGYDMVVGARNRASQANSARAIANGIYNRLGSWMVGHEIEDLTSGFRAVKADKFREFLYLLPNGFSYPTTSTMAFFRAGYSVAYLPIEAAKREGDSHIRPLQDGMRFLLIIFRVGTLYSPLKLFGPVSALFFLTGLGYYLYSFSVMGRFTNMSALLFIVSVVVFMIGLVSEQITGLLYKDTE